MNQKRTIFVLLFIIFFATITCIFPYPFGGGNLLSSDRTEINNEHENENNNILPSQSVKLLNVDWFEYVDNFFPLNKTTKIIDIYTNSSYFVQRLGGRNHADVQTIDYKNTQKFLSLYGGVWSWERRPVWVELDGKYFAASINGMPHGFDILKESQMGGHTCIHFLQSKTHGTKVVDSAHQNAVNFAAQNKDALLKYLKK